MKVIAIGAGFSGIYLSIRVPEWLRNVELVVYEKNDGLGGTWWENRYPGCACDIPGTSSPRMLQRRVLVPQNSPFVRTFMLYRKLHLLE